MKKDRGMSMNINKILELIEENNNSLWLDDLECTTECVVLEDSEKGHPECGEVVLIPYNGWHGHLEELAKAFGDLTPAEFEKLKNNTKK